MQTTELHSHPSINKLYHSTLSELYKKFTGKCQHNYIKFQVSIVKGNKIYKHYVLDTKCQYPAEHRLNVKLSRNVSINIILNYTNFLWIKHFCFTLIMQSRLCKIWQWIIFYWADILACIPTGIFTHTVLETCSAAYLVTVTSLAQHMVQFYVAVVPQTQDTWLASY
jgi:hypothetical protein